MSYRDLYCDKSKEYPIEELFKAIYLIQDLIDCKKEHAALVKKIISYWNKIPVKNGEKKYGYYHYYPNGLCKHSQCGSYISIDIDPYIIEEEKDIRKERKIPLKYSILKHFSKFWYYQVKEYSKTRYTIDSYDDIELIQYKEFEKIQYQVTPEELKLLDIQIREKNSICVRLHHLFEVYNIRKDSRYTFYFKLLTETQIKQIISLLEFERNNLVSQNWNLYYDAEKRVKKGIREITNFDNISEIADSYTSVDNTYDLSFHNVYNHFDGKYEKGKDVDPFYEFMLKFLDNINDAATLKILRKLNIITKEEEKRKIEETKAEKEETEEKQLDDKYITADYEVI